MKSVIRALLGVAVIATALAADQATEVRLRANLTGTGHGHVSWRTKDDSRRMQAELQAEGERLPANSTFMLEIGTNDPIAVTTDGFGRYDVDVRFNGATRPTISVGDEADLVDAGGNIVQSGIFAQDH